MLKFSLTRERCAPFVYDVWKSPETLAIISKIAGIDLVTAMDLEIGHVNISVQSEEQKTKALAAVAERVSREADEGVAGCPWEDENPIVDWHTDSYPFVCVTMLSDCTQMIGGETALRKGNGEIVKVRGPQMVSNQTPRPYNNPGTNKSWTGLWCCPPGSVHRAPGTPCAGSNGTHHDGDIIPPTLVCVA
jgi:hypothetical protein